LWSYSQLPSCLFFQLRCFSKSECANNGSDHSQYIVPENGGRHKGVCPAPGLFRKGWYVILGHEEVVPCPTCVKWSNRKCNRGATCWPNAARRTRQSDRLHLRAATLSHWRSHPGLRRRLFPLHRPRAPLRLPTLPVGWSLELGFRTPGNLRRGDKEVREARSRFPPCSLSPSHSLSLSQMAA